MSLADAVTYVWLGQALLALLPWVADPEIGQAVAAAASATTGCGRSIPILTGMRAPWDGCSPVPCRARR